MYLSKHMRFLFVVGLGMFSGFCSLAATGLVSVITASDLYVGNQVVGHVETTRDSKLMYRVVERRQGWVSLAKLDGTTLPGWLPEGSIASATEVASKVSCAYFSPEWLPPGKMTGDLELQIDPGTRVFIGQAEARPYRETSGWYFYIDATNLEPGEVQTCPLRVDYPDGTSKTSIVHFMKFGNNTLNLTEGVEPYCGPGSLKNAEVVDFRDYGDTAYVILRNQATGKKYRATIPGRTTTSTLGGYSFHSGPFVPPTRQVTPYYTDSTTQSDSFSRKSATAQKALEEKLPVSVVLDNRFTGNSMHGTDCSILDISL